MAKNEKKGSRGCLIALAIFFVLVFAVMAILYAIFDHYMDKTNYVEIDPDASIEISTGDYVEETVTGTNTPDEVLDEFLQDLEQNAGIVEEVESTEETTTEAPTTQQGNQGGQTPTTQAPTQKPTTPPTQKPTTPPTTQAPVTDVAGVEQILLIGSDRRSQNWNGNSDTMILVTINHNTKKIIMTSLMRDTYVYIPGVGNAKLNAAYAKGGPALLLQTIKQNYKINVNKFAVVDFSTFTNVINVLGTIPITLNDAEIAHMGSRLNGLEHNGNLYYLDGEAALVYARIRKVGRYDFERTERQRRVITEIVNKMKTMDAGQLNAMANAVLPYVTHNINNAEMLGYLSKAPNLLTYQLVSNRVPYDDLYQGAVINNQQVLVLRWNETRARLNAALYQ